MKSDSFTEDELIQQVQKICNSPEFNSKPILCKFLSYIVSETLAGRGENIKAYSIGVDVFNRDEDFDPGQDTLVRINAIRIRRMLDLYYSHTGKNDKLRIEIPKGGYLPRFISRLTPEDVKKVGPVVNQKLIPLVPSIAVYSFKDLVGNPKNASFSRGFSHELLVELSKYEDLQVFNYLSVTDHPKEGSDLYSSMVEKGIRFAIGGAIHRDKERINVLVELRDLYKAKQIWGERYSEKTDAKNFIQIQESITEKISGKLGSEYGIILQQLTQDAKRQKPQNISTYSAVLKYYNYLSSRSPESAREAFSALTKAVENDPSSGISLACLAAMNGTAYGMDYPDADKSYVAVGKMAEQAYLLDPYNLFVQIVLSFKYFLYDEKERFFDFSYQILKRNPKSTLRLGALGFHLSLYGDWIRGKEILDSVIFAHLEYPSYFHGATTLYYYRDKAYEQALQEANKYQLSHFFWGPMLRAAALGQLKRSENAGREIEQLKNLRPDFEKKAHYLISRFVKEEPLVSHVLEGLRKAGLEKI